MRCSDFRRDDHWIELREKHTQSDRPRLETAEIGPQRKGIDGRSLGAATIEWITHDAACPGRERAIVRCWRSSYRVGSMITGQTMGEPRLPQTLHRAACQLYQEFNGH